MILHGDLDAFYAAVAQRDHPELVGKPMVVAGSSRRAVVLTASYEARPHGIQSAMPLYQAKARCANLVVVAPEHEKYHEVSRALFDILHRHAGAVERISLDEAFCDLGELSADAAAAVGWKIKHAVHDTLKLNISVGIASGKMLAKIASDDGKPDGLVVVEPGTEAAYLREKPVRRLWGIGPKTERRLTSYGITTIGHIAALPDAALYELFGNWGPEVRALSLGIDRRGVSEDDSVRSISSEETFEQDITDVAAVLPLIRAQAQELAARLQHRALRASTVGVKIKLSDFRILGRQTSLAQPTDDARIIQAAAKFCLRRADPQKAIRLVGTRVASLSPAGARQIALFP